MKNKFTSSRCHGFHLLMTAAFIVLAPSTAMATSDTVNAVDIPVIANEEPVTVTDDVPAVTTDTPRLPEDVVVTPSADVPATSTAAPATEDLDPVTSITPLPESDLAEGEITAGSPMGATDAVQQHSGQYYDGMAVTPNNELAGAGAIGPRKVDPKYEPGQRYMIVERNAKETSTNAQYVAATRALSLGRYAAALDMFEKLYKLNDRDPRILLGLAVSQQGAGFVESASRTYEDLLKIDPMNEKAMVNLMGIMKSQYPAVTIHKLVSLQEKFPTNPGIPAQIGLAHAELKDYDDALRYLEIAASMDPHNPSHVFNMAIVSDMKGDAKRAIKLYESALQLDSTYGTSATSLNREEIYDRLSTLRHKV